VLLVEANLRTPALAALFGFRPPQCFSTQVEHHRDSPLDPWSVVEISPSLHVMAVWPEGEARPIVDGPAFAFALETLRRGYDYVVVDTPPVLGSADVNLLEDSADGVLIVTRAKQSSSRALRRAVDQLSPAKIVGITLIDA
jgi:Mrp family chromosome partitioning ATPase